MIDPADLAGLPPPEEPSAGSSSPRPRPRNYLATGERRQLFWRFMPAALAVVLALTVIETIWFPRAVPPAAPAVPEVDTRLERVKGPPLADGEVIIESDPEPFEPGAAELGAPASMLAKVRDDTTGFRDADREAWEQIFVTLRETGQAAVLAAPAQRVSFIELFGQPRSFRGRLVRMRGTLQGLERVPAPKNQYGIEFYWDGFIKPEGHARDYVLVHCLQVPAGMPTGKDIAEPVEIVGYFLKRDVYRAADAAHVAPLLLALEPVSRRPPPAAPTGTSLGTLALGSMAALLGCMVLVSFLSGRRTGARAAAPAVDLSTALAEHEPYSVAEELRRLGGAERHHEGQQA